MSSMKVAHRWHRTFLVLLGQAPDLALWEDVACFSQLQEASHPGLGLHLVGTVMSTLGLTAVTDPGPKAVYSLSQFICVTPGQGELVKFFNLHSPLPPPPPAGNRLREIKSLAQDHTAGKW